MNTHNQIVSEHVVVVPKRITSHSSLSDIVKAFEAPDVKETRMRPLHVSKWEVMAREKYHVERMKVQAKYAQSPDMNLTLKEILTGERISDKIVASLLVYAVGVGMILFTRL
jgi:hypothetical protein